MKQAATFLSIAFHPLFIVTYMSLVLLWTNPFSFGYRHVAEANTLLIIIVMTTVTLPGIAVVMMKMLGWIKTLNMDSRHERIGPYIVSGIMYLTLYLHLNRADTFPVSIKVAVLGSLIGLWTCFFINNFYKISAHAAGMGGLVGIVALTKLTFGYDQAQIGIPGHVNVFIPLDFILYATIFIAGLVCSSRMILRTHDLKEIYFGFTAGLLSVAIAFFILSD